MGNLVELLLRVRLLPTETGMSGLDRFRDERSLKKKAKQYFIQLY